MRVLTITLLAVFINTGFIIAQVTNAGFESWTSKGAYEVPDSWGTMNNATATYSLFTATKGTPGNPGTSYLKLTSKQIGGQAIPAIAVSGKLDSMTRQPIHGLPFAQRPVKLTGKWQYMGYGSGAGSISIILSKWNATLGERDTVASANVNLAGMVMAWGNFNIPLVYKDSLNYPDSCMITLRASGTPVTNNDYLWVDALAFTGTVSVYQPPVATGLIKQTAEDLSKLTLFPNPAQHEVVIRYYAEEAGQTTVQIIDVNGKLALEVPNLPLAAGNNELSLETSRLSSGLYLVQIRKNGAVQQGRKLLIQ